MQQMSKWHELEDDASRAVALLQKLTSRKEEMRDSLPRGTEPMPRSELHFCNGLAFTFVRKLGAGISFEAGHGFVIRKLYTGERDGRPTWSWSAPLFLTVAAAGLGLTLGYTEIESIVVLDTPEAVQSFTRSQWAVDTDITGAAGDALGAHLPATAANVSNMGLSDKTFTYSITRGAILDVSLTGLNYATDQMMNQSFYGGAASPQAILDGGVEPPEPMGELYACLDRVLNEYYDSVEGQAELEVQVEQAPLQRQQGDPGPSSGPSSRPGAAPQAAGVAATDPTPASGGGGAGGDGEIAAEGGPSGAPGAGGGSGASDGAAPATDEKVD